MNKHDTQKGGAYGTVPLCSQGEVALQHGVENGVVSADLLLFCIFSSSASSLGRRQRTLLRCFGNDNKPFKNQLHISTI